MKQGAPQGSIQDFLLGGGNGMKVSSLACSVEARVQHISGAFENPLAFLVCANHYLKINNEPHKS